MASKGILMRIHNHTKHLMIIICCVVVSIFPFSMAKADDFSSISSQATGQTVYFNAWGGSPAINAYIRWVGKRVEEDYGITLVHVKLTETAGAVTRILAEKASGKVSGGSVDLIWINGENFATMKNNGLLQSADWVSGLPNFALTNPEKLPGIISDFGTPTDGLESPWGRAQLVFGYDSAYVATPPISAEMLAKWIKNNPGQFSYPKPPDFTGTSFLKQILLEVSPDRSVFSKPADQADIDQALMPLWQWLDQVHPYLWRSGKAFPANYTALVQLLGDGEISIAMAFNPTEFSNGISQGILPDTVRTYIHDDGTLANVHFVAIPFNAAAPEAAQVVANFLLSPEAQIHKADTAIWGDPTVLDLSKVSASDQAAFMALPRGVATLSESDLGLTLAEPHPSWVGVIEREWARRYTGQ